MPTRATFRYYNMDFLNFILPIIIIMFSLIRDNILILSLSVNYFLLFTWDRPMIIVFLPSGSKRITIPGGGGAKK